MQRGIKQELCLQYITLLMTVLIFQFNPTDSSINNVTPGRITQLINPSKNSYSNFFKQNIYVKIVYNFSGTWYVLAILFKKYNLASNADKLFFFKCQLFQIFLKTPHKWNDYFFSVSRISVCFPFFFLHGFGFTYICIHGLWLCLSRNENAISIYGKTICPRKFVQLITS